MNRSPNRTFKSESRLELLVAVERVVVANAVLAQVDAMRLDARKAKKGQNLAAPKVAAPVEGRQDHLAEVEEAGLVDVGQAVVGQAVVGLADPVGRADAERWDEVDLWVEASVVSAVEMVEVAEVAEVAGQAEVVPVDLLRIATNPRRKKRKMTIRSRQLKVLASESSRCVLGFARCSQARAVHQLEADSAE